MDFNLDLTSLQAGQLAGLAVLVTVIDVVTAMVLAMTQRKFSFSYVVVWLESHTLKRIFPIFALGLLGNGVPPADIPPIPPLFGLAVAGLAGYLLETVKSIMFNFRDASPPGDTTSVPPA